MSKVKTSKKVKTSSKIKTDKGKINAINVHHGLKAEETILDRIDESYNPKRVTTNKTMSDYLTHGTYKPDIVFRKNDKDVFVEVKSIQEVVDSGDGTEKGRVQFKKIEIQDLAKKDGLVIVEVRSLPKRYFYAKASEVWELIKDEKGEEVKVEWSELMRFKEVTIKNPLLLPKQKVYLVDKYESFLKKHPKETFTRAELYASGFSENDIFWLMKESMVFKYQTSRDKTKERFKAI